MNTTNKKLLALAVISALGLTACGSDVDEPVVVIPPPKPPVVIAPPAAPALAVVVSGSLANTLTEDLVNTATLAFLENGVPSTNIRSVTGATITTLPVTDGSFNFTIRAGADVSNLSVVAVSEGFVDNSITLDLSDAEGQVPALIRMMPKNVAGVADTTSQTAMAAGAVATETVIQAATPSGSAATAVTVPAGTVLQDASGNPVAGNSVTLNVTTVATTAETAGGATAAAVIPAGLNANETQDLAVPVGVVNVKMTTNTGASVSRFSTPITLSMRIPADAVEPGEQLAVKAFDEDTGEWSTEALPATLSALDAATNSYTATFQVSHLTFFAATKNTPRCSLGSSLTFNGIDAVRNYNLNWKSDDIDVTETYSGSFLARSDIRMNEYYRSGIAANGTARMTVKDTNGGVWADTQSEVAMCNSSVTLNMVNPAPAFNKNLTVTATCPNSTVSTVVSNAIVRYQAPGKAWTTATESPANSGIYSLTGLTGTAAYNVNIVPRMTGAADQNFTVEPNATAATRAITLSSCQTATGAG